MERHARHISLWCTLSVLLAGGPAVAEYPGEEIVYAWDFTQATDALGWTALHSVGDLTVRDGALVCALTGSDPYIGSPPLDTVTSAEHLVRIVYRSSSSGAGQVFWAAAPDPATAEFRADAAVGVRFSKTDEWLTINASPGWEPDMPLARLRVDFPEEIGRVVEIQRIELVSRPAPESLPREPRYDFAQPGLALAFMPGPGMGQVHGEGDVLVCEPQTSPALVYSPPFALASESAGIASLGIRLDAPARIDVLFQRAGAGLFPPGEGVGIDVAASTEFQTINLDLRTAPAYKGEIGRLALRVWSKGDLRRVEVRSLAVVDRPRGGAWLHIERAMAPGVVAKLEPTLTVDCVLQNIGGRGSEGAEVVVTPPPGVSTSESITATVPATAPLEKVRVPIVVPIAPEFDGGWVDLPVRVTGGGSTVVRTLLVNVPGPEVTGSDPAPAGTAYLTPEGDAVMTNGQLTVVFPGMPEGFGAGVILDTSGIAPNRVGSFPSLGLVTEPGGTVRRIYTREYPIAASGPAGAQISFAVTVDLPTGSRSGTARFMMRSGTPEIECSLVLDAGEEVSLAGLVFPEFLAGDGAFGTDRDLAIFPGLEYLLPGEVSSGTDFVEPPASVRFAPHPYKATIPAMWVTSGERTVGLRWNPTQDWSGTGIYPTPVFASPDRLLGTPSHRMGLLTPGVLGGGEENALSLATPLRVGPDTPISIGATVFQLPEPDLEAACRHILEAMAGSMEAVPPPLPQPAPDLDTMIERAAYGFTHTLWIPEERRWHPNLPDAFGPHFNSGYAHVLWYFARMAPGSPHAEAAEGVLADALAAQEERGEGVGWDMAFSQGEALPAVAGIVAHGRAVAAAIRPDGTWPYHAGTQLRQSFGVDGDTSSGLVAANAERCLQAAAISGDPACLDAGLAALGHLDTQPRPEGAQTWELSLHVPDILTCGAAVRAHLLAYRLTGNRGQLASARRWAWRAMPFLYLWSPPERPIMRYGSIPVFGATHFTSPWFGWIVQWNGLDVAEGLLELAEEDDSFDWRTVAEGILLSAGQQMRPISREGFELAEHVPDTGQPGLYPDAYSAIAGTDAYTWDLEASRIARLAGRLKSDAGWARTEILRGEERVVTLCGMPEVVDSTIEADSVRLTLSLPPELGEHTVVLGRLNEPRSLTVDGQEAIRLEGAEPLTEPGAYQWDPALGLIVIQLPAGGPVEVIVTE